MSNIDAVAATYLNQVLLPLLFTLIITYYFLKNIGKIRMRVFAWMQIRLYKGYNLVADDIKTQLFKELQDFKSLDWDLRNKGLIRILEIGVGPGSNFKFYPKNARLVAVDPNPHFESEFMKNSHEFPDVKLEQIILGVGENLSEVKDNSVDVVVTTLVLCSVRDVKTVLNEIKRVLAPGGKFFFLEHVLGPEGSWHHRLQRIFQPIWPLLFDGCNVTRDIGKSIKQAGFSEVNLKNVIMPIQPYFRVIVGPHIVGTVQK